MAITVTGGATAPPVTLSFTLVQLVAKWRARLADTAGTVPLWSNDEFTEYVDTLQKQLCAELNLLEDRTTTSICSVALAQGNGLVTLSPRILHIKQARIDGATSLLALRSSDEMDGYYAPGWDTASVPQGPPTILVNNGMGQGKAYLYPPLDAVAGGTLKLVVYRLPLADLDYATHSAQSLEIDKYAHLLFNGVMWQAYLKQDSDAYDPKKAEQHRVFWEGKEGYGGDKEKIRQMVLKEHARDCQARPHLGFM